MSSGFSFGTPAGTSGFSFNTPTSTAPAATPSASSTGGFSFGLTSGAAPISAPATTSVTSGAIKFPSFSFSNPATTSTSGFNLGSATTAVVSSSTPAVATVPSFNLASSNSSAPPSFGNALGTFNLGKPAASSVNSTNTMNLTLSSASTPITASFGSSTSASLTTATTTTTFGASGAGGSANLSMRQLEEKMNKWLVELKEQEDRFLRQAAHVNAWDQILHKGHEEVHALKETLHTVESDQSRLEAEIDFIRSQQEELERLLEPLEAVSSSNSASQMHQGDRQRDNMYYLSQSLDAQLRQMTDDLGKVIEHLNSGGDSAQPNDPVSMITKILSAHMDTLKWVDQNATTLAQKIDDISGLTSGARVP